MAADFFTKPTQGALFLRQRDMIMNIDPSSVYYSGHRSVLENPVRCQPTGNGQTDMDTATKIESSELTTAGGTEQMIEQAP